MNPPVPSSQPTDDPVPPVIEVEAEPMPREEHESPPSRGKRLSRALSPILIGMGIDAIDSLTMGPLGVMAGLIVGGLAGYWMCTKAGIDWRKSVAIGLACAIYLVLPFNFLPLATIAGSVVRYFESDDQDD